MKSILIIYKGDFHYDERTYSSKEPSVKTTPNHNYAR